MIYSYFSYLLFSFTFFLFILLINFNKPFFCEIEIFQIHDVSLILSFMISFTNLLFVFTVFSIFSSVYYYSLSYMKDDPFIKRFLKILSSFVISMVILICSSNMFTSLLGWDGLGVTSLLLIMHYCSKSSLKASMYTFLINRLGDCFFLILIFSLVCFYPSLNVLLYNSYNHSSSWLIALLILFLAITKSAQIPFSSWLTKAMEAPTPVSSLVHSSTLVTAGVFMLYTYSSLWNSKEEVCLLLLILSFSTLLIASICGMVEVDLKKIVAYSTLSQLGFVFFLFSLEVFEAGFFYLIIHAFFKALMFMSSGYIIHHSSGWQDIRKMTLNVSCSPSMVKIFYVSCMSLCGMPFMAGFFSKDLVLDKILLTNYPMILFFFLIVSFTLTIFYTLRVCWYLLLSCKPYSTISDQDEIMILSTLFLFLLSCTMGSILSWMYLPFSVPVDSPKIVLTLFLVFMGMMLYNTPNVNSSFFFKTMLYMYVLYNSSVTIFMNMVKKLLWYFDLLGLMGKMIKKFPSKVVYNEFDNWFKLYNWSFKDFFFSSMLLYIFYEFLMNW